MAADESLDIVEIMRLAFDIDDDTFRATIV